MSTIPTCTPGNIWSKRRYPVGERPKYCLTSGKTAAGGNWVEGKEEEDRTRVINNLHPKLFGISYRNLLGNSLQSLQRALSPRSPSGEEEGGQWEAH